jgi:hypothetical protein
MRVLHFVPVRGVNAIPIPENGHSIQSKGAL